MNCKKIDYEMKWQFFEKRAKIILQNIAGNTLNLLFWHNSY
jgi:hypothetical protein